MAKEIRIIIRNTPTGADSTPWLNSHRERFKQAAKEVAAEMKNSKLKGANRIRVFNARISERLKKLK